MTNSTSFREFRPISLCNVCYKVVSKIVTERLRVFLDRLISPEQCGFVQWRHIHDNIMLVHELAQSLDQDIRGSNVIMKLDMENAFDRLEWRSITEVLRRFGFATAVINLVDICVRENHFSVLVNGHSTPFFTASLGLRQGDPLSPTLFILVEEILSRSLSRAIAQGLIQPYFSKRGCPIISHSVFADDAILFLNWCEASLQGLMGILSGYERATGQLVNTSKSSFFYYHKHYSSHNKKSWVYPVAIYLSIILDALPSQDAQESTTLMDYWINWRRNSRDGSSSFSHTEGASSLFATYSWACRYIS